MIIVPSLWVFVILYILSFFFVVSASDWFGVWLGLEINLMSFLVLIYDRWSMINIESCLKYFFIQSVGSAFFIGVFYFCNEMVEESMILALSLKLGAAPMYFWFPSVCEGLTWWCCFLLMIFQKLLPLFLLMLFVSWMMKVIVWLSLIIGVMGSFNQVKLKLLLAYSSIHHIGWMLMCGMGEEMVWFYYLLIYAFVLLGVIYSFKIFNVDSFIMISKQKGKMMIVFNVLSMAGMPPLLGFFLKWFAFYYILNESIFIVAIMVLISVIMFYIYFRMLYVVIMSGVVEYGWEINSIKYLYMFDVVSMFGVIFSFLILIYLY